MIIKIIFFYLNNYSKRVVMDHYLLNIIHNIIEEEPINRNTQIKIGNFHHKYTNRVHHLGLNYAPVKRSLFSNN
jgi:hypothetical protein